MERYEGSSAVSRARTAINVFIWISFFGCLISFLLGIDFGYGADWTIIYIGIALALNGIVCCLANAILKGFEQIVRASETYLEKTDREKIERKAEE